jgi:hypothetical protein
MTGWLVYEVKKMKWDLKAKKQVLIFLLFISGLYMLGVISGFLNSFNLNFGGITLVMVMGIMDLYFGYLVYNNEL